MDSKVNSRIIQKQLRELNDMKHRLEKRIGQMEYKYFNLVHYARRMEELPHHEEIRQEFPKETKDLDEESDISNPDWEHGFNSGCLATCRLLGRYARTQQEIDQETDEWFRLNPEELEEIKEEGGEIYQNIVDNLQEAEEEFPWLDT